MASEVVRSRFDRLVGGSARWDPATGGYSGAERYRVTRPNGTGVFVKIGTTPWTAAAVRREAELYGQVEWSFAPRLEGADLDDPPLIVLEDLGEAIWPPPWNPDFVDRVHATLATVAKTTAPPHLGRLADLRDLLMRGWSEVATDPTAFLSLGMCSASWLEEALPILLAAQEETDLDGESLTHLDVRSDNICFAGERTVLVDWAGACVAHPLTDSMKWATTLHAEGGPAPEAVVPDAPPGAVAVLAGFWAANAGREPPPFAPTVREVQQRQLAGALPWAARLLGLPIPALVSVEQAHSVGTACWRRSR